MKIIDPPIYKDSHEYQKSLEMVAAQLQRIGGYVALADGQVAGGVLLHVDEDHRSANLQRLARVSKIPGDGCGTTTTYWWLCRSRGWAGGRRGFVTCR